MNLKLIESIKAGDASKVIWAIENGADINFNAPSPLVTAAEENNLEIVNLLLDHGAIPNKRYYGRSALAAAALESRNLLMVKALIQAGASPNTYLHQASVLSHACYHNVKEDGKWKLYPIDDRSYEIAKFLLESGASADGGRGDCPACPIEQPIEANDFRTVQLLIDYGAKLTVIPVLTAANWCAHVGRYEMLKLLLKNKFKPNPKKAKDKLHASPLHYAIAGGHKNIVELLLEYKINVNYFPNYSSPTALLQHLYFEQHPIAVSIEHKHIEILKLLLENGADPTGAAANNSHYCPHIFEAIGKKFSAQESIEFIELLLEAGADINKKRYDVTPLSWAIKEGYDEIAEFLKSKGATEVNSIAEQLFGYRDSALAIYGESYLTKISEYSEKISAAIEQNNVDAIPAALFLASAANNQMEKMLLMAGLCEILAPLIERDEEALGILSIEAMFRCRDRVKTQLGASEYAAKMKECGLAVVEEARRTELAVMLCGCAVAARQTCDEVAVQVIAATVELLE